MAEPETPRPNGVGVGRRCLFALAAMVGALIAIIGDIAQKPEASAVTTIAATANSGLDLALPTFAWALLLIALDVALCFIMEARTTLQSFYAGASIVAVVMTTVPFDPPAANASGDESETTSRDAAALLRPASYLPTLVPAAVTDEMTLALSLSAPAGGQPAKVTVTVFDGGTEKKWQKRLYVEPGATRHEVWTLPKLDYERTVHVRAEAASYSSVSESRQVHANASKAAIAIDLKLKFLAASAPEAVQGLQVLGGWERPFSRR